MSTIKIVSVVLGVVLAFMASTAQATVVSSWDFEEGVGTTVADGPGSLDATQTGGTWVTTGDYWGQLGTSLQVNRPEGDTVLAPYAGELSALTSMTVEMWLKSELPPYVAGNWVDLFAMPGCVQGYYHMAGVPVGNPQWRTMVGGWDTGYRGMGMLPLDTWTQVVVTYDGSTDTGTLYINGTSWLYNSNTGTWGYVTGTGTGLDLSAAGNIALSNGFNGVVDHFSIHDAALTSAEVTARYQEVISPQFTGIVHQWALDDGSGPTAVDDPGDADGTLSTNASWTTGVTGGGLDVSTDGAMSVGDLPTAGWDEMSIEMWVNADTDYGASARYPLYSTGVSILESSAYTYTGGALRVLAFGSNIYPGKSLDKDAGWQQLVITYAADDTVVFYLDGVASGSATGTGLTDTGALDIGSAGVYGGPLDGQFDQITIWNRALTPAEVLANYNDPLPEPATLAVLAMGGVLALLRRRRA